MAKNTLEYKGYTGSIIVSVDDGVIHGKIEFINDLVTYEATSINELKVSFEAAVDDYLDTCRIVGKEPDKKLSGSLNVRIGSDLHKLVATEAINSNTSINDVIKKAVEESLCQKRKEIHLHIHESQVKSSLTQTVESWDQTTFVDDNNSFLNIRH